jgi:site-specific recombinase XerD
MSRAQKSQVDWQHDERDDVPTWLKPDQVDQLLDAIYQCRPDYLQQRDEALILLTYDAGLRAAEAVGLDVEHLHLDDDEPHVFLTPELQKGADEHLRPQPINLRPSLATARRLRAYRRDRWKAPRNGALFPSRSSDRMTTQAFRDLLRRLATEAEVAPYRTEDNVQVQPEHVSPHTLRHSLFYREFVEEDRRLKEVSLRLRHAKVATTEEFYANLIRV